MKRALLALLAPLALAFPSTAHATPEQDGQLIDLLWSSGMSIGPYASYNAQLSCAELRAGYSFEDVAWDNYIQDDGIYTLDGARAVLTIYATVYCPEQLRIGKLLA